MQRDLEHRNNCHVEPRNDLCRQAFLKVKMGYKAWHKAPIQVLCRDLEFLIRGLFRIID